MYYLAGCIQDIVTKQKPNIYIEGEESSYEIIIKYIDNQTVIYIHSPIITF